MPEWKSLFVAFIADSEAPTALDGSVFDDASSALLSHAEETGRLRTFETDAFEYRTFLDPLLTAYGLPESESFKRLVRADDGLQMFLPAAQRPAHGQMMAELARRFQADPIRATSVFSHHADNTRSRTANRVLAHATETTTLRQEEPVQQADSPLDAINSDLLLALWDANQGIGYQDGTYPEAANALFSRLPSPLLVTLFQTFGYTKAMRTWCAQAEGLGLLEIMS